MKTTRNYANRRILTTKIEGKIIVMNDGMAALLMGERREIRLA